jgi:cysteine desulfurase/selenocysteine lyase
MSASPETANTPASPFDVEAIRRQFPILETLVRGKPLTFLDSAASAQKPRAVIEAIGDLYSHGYANIHRGVYQLSAEATRRYEAARARAAAFIGAADPRECVFVRNTTEAINLVARTWAETELEAGDEIVISELEHHANIVPWQMLRDRIGVTLKVVPVEEDGSVDVDRFGALLGPRTRLVALAHVSNTLGTVLPLEHMIPLAKAVGATVLVDGAQAVPHRTVDVQALGCDFYAFSGHKLFGPSGIGVLQGRLSLLDAMPPFLGGGGMIETVTFEKTTYAPVPEKFEAGTPDIAGAIGLGAAIDWVEGVGIERIHAWETELLQHATSALSALPGLRILGTAPGKAAVVSFVLDGVHAHDVGTILDREGVAVRVGHHCTQPLMKRFGVPATVRASFSVYNTHADVDALVAGLEKTMEIFGR